MSKKAINQPAITFLIPSYQALALLQKNLPSIFSEAVSGDRILISEDAVKNFDSLNYFQQKYPLELTHTPSGDLWQAEIKIGAKKLLFSFLQRRENGRFARNVNDAAKLIDHDYFILLNNDVELTSGVRKQLLGAITNKVFAVTAKEIDVNHHCQECGRNKLWWAHGRFWHARDENLNQSGQTAWACGGSSLYVTKIWHELGGFDTRYYPAYWEDIDLSFTAIKKGYRVIYQPHAIVKHTHETTNETVFGQQKMTEMSWRCGSRFAWKNGNWWQKLQFLLFYPYWQTKQFPQLKLWWLVLLLALLTRASFLSVPNGLTVDEAAIAYNGYGIVTQRRDEWLNRLPISFRSYGDFKAPLAIYLNGFLTTIFGREIWLIRLPFMLAGITAIWFMMLLTDLLLQNLKPNHRHYGAAVGLLMTFLPWHFHYSHLGFENNYALVFTLAGSYFFLRQIKQTTNWRGISWSQKWWSWSWALSGICFALSLYSYHSAKVTIPILALFFLIFYWRQIVRLRRLLLIPIIISVLILHPLLKDSFDGEGLTRANSSFLTDKNIDVPSKIKLLGENFTRHFAPNYLYFGGLNTSTIKGEIVPNVRHGDGVKGILNETTIFLLALAIIALVKFKKVRHEYRELLYLSLVIIFAGILPAALTTQAPHSNQAFLSLPGFLLLAIIGLASWRYFWRRRITFYRSFVNLFFILASLIFLQYQANYHHIFALELPNSDKNQQLQQSVTYLFAVNLLDAFKITTQLEKQVNQIIISTGREHEYIYALLARGTRPEAYQHGSLSHKHFFTNKISPSDWLKENVVILLDEQYNEGRPSAAQAELIKQFYDGSGEETLAIYRTK